MVFIRFSKHRPKQASTLKGACKIEFIMDNQMIFVRIATEEDIRYAHEIVNETAASAIARGSGISNRTVESIAEKMKGGKAVVAVTGTGEWVGFAYFEVWQNNSFVANSGLIVAPRFRHAGVARAIKERIFRMSRSRYPGAKIFSITSGAAMMKLNTQLGFEPVSFAQITQDEFFWEGCKSCVNYNILENKKRCNCLCTAMLFDPHKAEGGQPAKNINRLQVMRLECTAHPGASLVPFAEGTNALCTALNDIRWFSEYVFPIERDLPDPVRMQVTAIHTDIMTNNLAGQCSFTVEIRYDHSYTAKEILNTVRNHIRSKFDVHDDILVSNNC